MKPVAARRSGTGVEWGWEKLRGEVMASSRDNGCFDFGIKRPHSALFYPLSRPCAAEGSRIHATHAPREKKGSGVKARARAFQKDPSFNSTLGGPVVAELLCTRERRPHSIMFLRVKRHSRSAVLLEKWRQADRPRIASPRGAEGLFFERLRVRFEPR